MSATDELIEAIKEQCWSDGPCDPPESLMSRLYLYEITGILNEHLPKIQLEADRLPLFVEWWNEHRKKRAQIYWEDLEQFAKWQNKLKDAQQNKIETEE